jgi:hypothetical protein
MENNMENKEDKLEEIIKNTPQIFSTNEIAGLLEDEDWLIYERRCAEREF